MRPLHSRPLVRRAAALLRREDGVEAPELALVGAMIVTAVLLAFPVFLDAVAATFDTATTVMQTVVSDELN